MAVDMSILWLLTSVLGWSLSLSKALAAEVAICNNFLWNDIWTFCGLTLTPGRGHERLIRWTKFNVVCLAGVGLSVLLLNVQVHGLHMNLYVSNLITVVLASIWNFLISLRFAWSGPFA